MISSLVLRIFGISCILHGYWCLLSITIFQEKGSPLTRHVS